MSAFGGKADIDLTPRPLLTQSGYRRCAAPTRARFGHVAAILSGIVFASKQSAGIAGGQFANGFGGGIRAKTTRGSAKAKGKPNQYHNDFGVRNHLSCNARARVRRHKLRTSNGRTD